MVVTTFRKISDASRETGKLLSFFSPE